ncbi:6-phosphogluconolactonase [Gleimia europaea]|uniref:6-phosphogluconolactonase n=1 Tax=Gleimia europaea ACS-120-V-Col10b TaxID=883069 RepID=A0A9W5RDK3_9ACTO|nr:6-phosphogluconolactonase [Gleimia europaea]EPD30503.1 6-phosphogluconolactonase [Gleimia europaea ACS-120-V-Col10b]
MLETDLQVHRTVDELHAKVALSLVRKITELSQQRSRIHLGIASDISSTLLHKIADIMHHHPDLVDQWSPVHIWMADERYVDHDHVDRADTHIDEALASRFPIVQLHRPPSPANSKNLQAAARQYEEEMVAVYSVHTLLDPRSIALDLSLLGIGQDGHFASLFPSHNTLDATGLYVAEPHSPKPPAQRISMTIPVLRRSRASWFVVAGKEKATVFAQALQGANFREVPAGAMNQVGTQWWVDKSAASRIDRIF